MIVRGVGYALIPEVVDLGGVEICVCACVKAINRFNMSGRRVNGVMSMGGN